MMNRIYSSIQFVVICVRTLKAVVFPQSNQPFWTWTQMKVQDLPELDMESELEQPSLEMSVISQTNVN